MSGSDGQLSAAGQHVVAACRWSCWPPLHPLELVPSPGFPLRCENQTQYLHQRERVQRLMMSQCTGIIFRGVNVVAFYPRTATKSLWCRWKRVVATFLRNCAGLSRGAEA